MNDDELEAAIRTIIVDATLQPSLPFTSAAKIMATLRASGRLAPAVEGDVSNWIIGITAPAHHAFRMAVPNDEIIYSQYWAALDAAISAVLPIIVSATEARVREECAELAWVQAKQGATSDQIRNAIRTGAAR